MNQQGFLKNFTILIMLVASGISMTPKSYFHDLVADHRDESACSRLEHHGESVHHLGIACHFDDLVVSAPFYPETVPPVSFFISYQDKKFLVCFPSFLSAFMRFAENRGPPSL